VWNYVKAGVLFEEDIIQKMLVIEYTIVNNTVPQMEWIFI
jgi:hypothetical protein